ncbi:MAG: MFS transporter [Sphaerochaetaceae bacterium]|nr:MFS transporter [Sphaerochaetaceae bacterium]
MKMTKPEKSWIMYDVANSVYATVMLAAIFPTYFATVCKGVGVSGDFWWGIGTSIGTFTLAILAPVIGAFADVNGYKKKLFSAFLAIGLVFTLVNAFTDNWSMLLVGYILSHIGFQGSCLLNDSFLTDVTTPDRMDSISSWAYALGYIGGSTIPFLVCIALIMFGENFGVDSAMAVKLSVVITTVWWGLFSIPFLKNVKQLHGIEKPQKGIVKDAFVRIGRTARKIATNKAMLLFILAYFFYIDGVNTVISMSTAYGSSIGLGTTGMVLALMVTQIVAFPCAILFGKLAGKHGSIKMLIVSIVIYFLICLTGFVMGLGLEDGFLTVAQATVLFWVLATLVGTVQGGIQAISRSFYGKLVPPENSGEYFGFFDIFGKFAAVIGPALYSLVKGLTGRGSYAILSIVLLFAAGFVLLFCGRKQYESIDAPKA